MTRELARLYLYNNLHAGDVLFSRPLYRLLAADGRFDLLLGAHRNNAYLLEDLLGARVALHVSDYPEQGPSILYDLGADCPETHLPISTWLGEYPDTGNHQWRNVVEVCRRKLAEYGIAWQVPDVECVPMIDFAPRPLARRLQQPTLYVDNSLARSGHSDFEFDLAALVERFPRHHLLTTAAPGWRHARVIDGSRLDLRDLSALSEQCDVILGKGSGPFCCTYTEANRRRPRAVCGYRSALSPTFWDYPGNPLRYLGSMADVLEFVAEALDARGAVVEVGQC